MSKAEKLLNRFLSKPKDFSFRELKSLLAGFGYKESKKGKASGLRVAFIHEKSKHIIRLHTPHPKPVFKAYQLDLVANALREEGHIE